MHKGLNLCLYSREEIHPDFKERFKGKGITYRSAPGSNYLYWEQILLPKWCKEDRVDILHSPFNYGLPIKSPCLKVLTLHDAIEQKFHFPLLSFKEKMKPSSLKYRFIQSMAPRVADHIITVSQHAKLDLINELNIPKEKISVTYEAHPKEFEVRLSDEEKAAALKNYNIDFPYFFYVGGFDERKNLPFLLEAFAKASLTKHRLVLGGGGDTSELEKIATELGINSLVHFSGYIKDEDLPAFYQGAEAFAYPSRYEGFGLQVCEAMASACPTFVSDQASLPEVLGKGGLVFDLNDASHLADMISKVANSKEVREKLSKDAKARSKDFSWDKLALQTIEIYKRLLGKG
ncbi:MAG: glycosyltransferase involved in cell wall biosynthesis [Bacteriovoracaceae bacterium]|jgi:glycosyltransferase involved in cell wall biosynthesis